MKSLERLVQFCSHSACWIPPQHHVRADRVTWTSARVHMVGNSAGLQAGSPINLTTLMKTALFSSFTRSTPSSACKQQSSPPQICIACTGCGHTVASTGCLIPAHFIQQDAVRAQVLCFCTRIKVWRWWGEGWQHWLLLTGSAKLIHTWLMAATWDNVLGLS